MKLVQGADFWTTAPIPSIGLRAMTLSDGPAGVRGPRWDERLPSLNLPSGSALGASWDEELAERYGVASAVEARRKGVDIVLGPTINLHRSPLGGRHFECLSEDPELSGRIGAAYVRGLQANGVAATPKHYVANDSETDRFTVDVRVDARALRELYLAPFERAVEAGAWGMMSAYNAVNGVTMTESDLLESPLNDEWGFDGVVISDWTAVRSLAAVPAAQDLAMPGPHTSWSELGSAVRDGIVDEADLDRKVLRILLLAERVGALGDQQPAPQAAFDGVSFAREASAAGSVLLTNHGILPFDPAVARSIAVIGEPARAPRTQGGGSATVIPERVISPLDALRAAVPDTQVRFAVGAELSHTLMELPLAQLTNPVTHEPGVRISFADAAGSELFADDRRSTALVWFGGDAPLARSATLRVSTIFTPDTDGEIELGFAASNHAAMSVGGSTLIEGRPAVEGMDLGAAFLQPPVLSAHVAVRQGVPIELSIVFSIDGDDGLPLDALSVALGIVPPRGDADALIESAARLAAESDVAVVVVGTDTEVESEGYDRSDLNLPGRQDDLVRAVIDANPRTIVVVNAGAPVLLPWADRAAAVIVSYFGGQEFGPALADILTGTVEPGGRLPTTWPRALEEVPVRDVVPVDGVLNYDEGIHVGYRAWLRANTAPAFVFGHGLGYTDWSWTSVERDGDDLVVTLANTGRRPGKNVVQVYAERPDSAVERPVRWLVGFAVVTAEPAERVACRIAIDPRRLAHWDDGWNLEPGAFTLRIGGSVEHLPLSLTWETTEAMKEVEDA
ncbi:glycoside hydrolase family 3 C-terminal domain-containing protein [Microbacterium sp. 2FI]|uniref:beta-glucosidase family protein n=1 Tax=Microbacterium sp. 2FI TaxID=2502193 RepID=UPI0032C42BCE